jgi:hypothetical protein
MSKAGRRWLRGSHRALPSNIPRGPTNRECGQGSNLPNYMCNPRVIPVQHCRGFFAITVMVGCHALPDFAVAPRRRTQNCPGSRIRTEWVPQYLGRRQDLQGSTRRYLAVSRPTRSQVKTGHLPIPTKVISLLTVLIIQVPASAIRSVSVVVLSGTRTIRVVF